MVRCSRLLKEGYVALSEKFGLPISELGRIALEEYIQNHRTDEKLSVPARGHAIPGEAGEDVGENVPDSAKELVKYEFRRTNEKAPSYAAVARAAIRMGEVLSSARG